MNQIILLALELSRARKWEFRDNSSDFRPSYTLTVYGLNEEDLKTLKELVAAILSPFFEYEIVGAE